MNQAHEWRLGVCAVERRRFPEGDTLLHHVMFLPAATGLGHFPPPSRVSGGDRCSLETGRRGG
jgi:hypothetical protein